MLRRAISYDDLNIKSNAISSFGWLVWFVANLAGEKLDDELEVNFFSVPLIIFLSVFYNLVASLIASDDYENSSYQVRVICFEENAKTVINVIVDTSFYFSNLIPAELPVETSSEEYLASLLVNTGGCAIVFAAFSKLIYKRQDADRFRDDAMIIALSAFIYTAIDDSDSLDKYSKAVLIPITSFIASCIYCKLSGKEGVREKFRKFIYHLACFIGLTLNYATIFCNLYGAMKDGVSSDLDEGYYLEGKSPSYIDSLDKLSELSKINSDSINRVSSFLFSSFLISSFRFVFFVASSDVSDRLPNRNQGNGSTNIIVGKILSAVLAAPAGMLFVCGSDRLNIYSLTAASVAYVCSFLYFKEIDLSKNILLDFAGNYYNGEDSFNPPFNIMSACLCVVSGFFVNLSFTKALPSYLPLPVAFTWAVIKAFNIKNSLEAKIYKQSFFEDLSCGDKLFFVTCAVSDELPTCVLAVFSTIEMETLLLSSSAAKVVWSYSMFSSAPKHSPDVEALIHSGDPLLNVVGSNSNSNSDRDSDSDDFLEGRMSW